MRYNFVEIGQRIRSLRKSKKWSQDDFVDQLKEKYLPITRKTISRIEQGDENKFTLPFLLTACEVFNCDMGYLLGEYGDCKTRDNQFIHDTTGLSELSINRLIGNRGIPENDFIEFLLSSDSFCDIDYEFSQFKSAISQSNTTVRNYEALEAALAQVETDNPDKEEIEKKLTELLFLSGRYEDRIASEEYKVSLRFSNMLDLYRKSEVIIYGSHRED